MAFEGLSDKLGQIFRKLKTRGKLTENDVKEAMREVRLRSSKPMSAIRSSRILSAKSPHAQSAKKSSAA